MNINDFTYKHSSILSPKDLRFSFTFIWACTSFKLKSGIRLNILTILEILSLFDKFSNTFLNQVIKDSGLNQVHTHLLLFA